MSALPVMRQPIPIERFTVDAHRLWADQWLLLTAGDFAAGRYNTMTVGWGSFGTMWGQPIAMVVVRPHRHTFRFMEEFPTFTLCAFAARHRAALQLLGARSGRDGDKITASGLTPVAAGGVAAPIFAEAELAVECRRIYRDDFDPSRFEDEAIHACYPKRDYHRMYFGQIVAVAGTDHYTRSQTA